VVCAGCQHANPPPAKFCQQCGQPLAAAPICAQCGTALPPSARFCHACGAPQSPSAAAEQQRSPAAYTPNHLAEKILRSRGALEGERKQVTVLFADVKGSLELSERIDPEEWHRVLDGFLRILAEGVHRFEGTVNQYTGDGIMALFGAPIAHEDHAQRACFAALALQTELRRYADALRVEKGLSFGVRIGLNSGEVVVGRIGDDLRMDYTAQGHTVGLAARMEQLAEPGRVFLTEHTARLVSGYFRLADLGATRVRGVTDPVGVYELLGVGDLRTRLDLARARGFSRFVGRKGELELLGKALRDAYEGDGRVVAVVGEAGVGKSRLCLEFEQSARAAGVAVYGAQCPPHGRLLPDLPITQLLRALFELDDDDDEHAARRKIAGELLLLEPSLQDALPLVLDFLGIPDPGKTPAGDPRSRRERFAALLGKLVRARAARGPVAFSIDDLHFVDPASDALVTLLAEAVRGSRALLLVNFRPEYSAAWTRAAHCVSVPLGPLSDDAIAEMLRDLLGDELAQGPVGALVRERTSGNPFFVEELVQALVESGQLAGERGRYRLAGPLEALAIPATVQAVIAARIDRLADEHKQVLQAAAVVGKRFAGAVLARALGWSEADLAAALAALEQAEFIHLEQLHPEREYAFRHPLTQEIAYGSQLSERRAELHAAVARALAESPSPRLGELAPLLAEHWESARRPREAANWHRIAAESAGFRDFVAAERHWRRVRDLVTRERLDEETRELAIVARLGLLGVAGRQGLAKEEAELLRDEASALLVGHENPGQQYYLHSSYGLTCLFAGDFEEALEVFRAAQPFGAQLGEVASIGARATCAWALSLLGRLGEALREVDGVLGALEADRALAAAYDASPPGRPAFLALRASILAPLGRYDEAETCAERAIEGAQAMGALDWVGVALSTSAAVAYCRGDAERVARAGARAFEVGARIGYVGSRIDGLHALGAAALLRGDYARAIEHLDAAIAEMQRTSNVIGEPHVTCLLSQACLGAGDARRALALAKNAVTSSALRGARHQEIEAQLALGGALLADGKRSAPAAAETALKRAEQLLAETHSRCFAAPVHELRAALAEARKDAAGRARELSAALALYRELGAPGQAARVERMLG
jgi:class 3 adenylate cyclase/tetratricopeptide (TPR) repeat protein